MNPYGYGYGYGFQQPQRKSSVGIIVAVIIVIVLLISGYFVYTKVINTNSGGLDECKAILTPIDKNTTSADLQKVYSYRSHLSECINDCNDLAKAAMYAFPAGLMYARYPETSPEVVNRDTYMAEITRVATVKFGGLETCQTESQAEIQRVEDRMA